MTRTRLRTAQEACVRTGRALLDSLGDGLQLEQDSYYHFLAMSMAFRDLDDLVPPEIDGEGHAANADGPDTEHAAASLAHLAQFSMRRDIVHLLQITEFRGEPGLTDWQIRGRLNVEDRASTQTSARNWLVETGWIVDSGARRPRPSTGRDAIVWTLTAAARDQLRLDAQS